MCASSASLWCARWYRASTRSAWATACERSAGSGSGWFPRSSATAVSPPDPATIPPPTLTPEDQPDDDVDDSDRDRRTITGRAVPVGTLSRELQDEQVR